MDKSFAGSLPLSSPGVVLGGIVVPGGVVVPGGADGGGYAKFHMNPVSLGFALGIPDASLIQSMLGMDGLYPSLDTATAQRRHPSSGPYLDV